MVGTNLKTYRYCVNLSLNNIFRNAKLASFPP